jgi:hypothetical protein
MRDAITFLMGLGAGGIAGWAMRAVKIEIDKERKVDRLFRHYQELAEKKANQ